MGSLSLLQGIFPTQESNRGLLHCRRILYQLSYQVSPRPRLLLNIPHQRLSSPGTGPWSVRNRAAQQEVSSWQANPRSFICIYIRSPWVSHQPQMGPSRCRKTSWGLPPILSYGELDNHFITCHHVAVVDVKWTMDVTHLNHPKTLPSLLPVLPPPSTETSP